MAERDNPDTPLSHIIREKIKENGPMPISEYMGLCLGHPEHGYYMKQDPFGREGDFITAPEVSQMFGEMLGAWIIDTWQKMGMPSDITLLECGPGRGTLMSDILRVAKQVPEFWQAVHVQLMETSPVLKDKQEKALGVYDLPHAAEWITCTESVHPSFPVIAIGNEFLDALPVDQYVFTDTGWAKKFIDVEKNESFRICENAQNSNDESIEKHIPNGLFKPKLGEIVEVSLEERRINSELIEIVLKQGGSILWIDYGFKNYGRGDTLQVVKSHEYSTLLAEPGESDITYHINFADLADRAMAKNMVVHGAVSQKNFLTSLGIEKRAEILRQCATEMQRRDIDAALDRLIGDDQMGDLFKVIAFTNNPDIELAGF